MTAAETPARDVAARARAHRNGTHAAVCDLLEPWAHGTVARARRHPSYFDFNVVRVEDDPGMGADALAEFADQALAGLAHRRLDFDRIDVAEPLRSDFEGRGWKATRLIWMRHSSPLPDGPETTVEEVPYDAAHELRVAWHREDFPGLDPAGFHAEEREVALQRGVQVLAVSEGGAPVAFAELERNGATAEITSVYVHPEYRGAGRGTAITRAAIEAAGGAEDLWIVADDDGRAKQVYRRLGFRPAWRTMEFLLPPGAGA